MEYQRTRWVSIRNNEKIKATRNNELIDCPSKNENIFSTEAPADIERPMIAAHTPMNIAKTLFFDSIVNIRLRNLWVSNDRGDLFLSLKSSKLSISLASSRNLELGMPKVFSSHSFFSFNILVSSVLNRDFALLITSLSLIV